MSSDGTRKLNNDDTTGIRVETSRRDNDDYELREWPTSVIDVREPIKTRSKLRLIAVLAGLNVSTP
jgi:hypothetical protein